MLIQNLLMIRSHQWVHRQGIPRPGARSFAKQWPLRGGKWRAKWRCCVMNGEGRPTTMMRIDPLLGWQCNSHCLKQSGILYDLLQWTWWTIGGRSVRSGYNPPTNQCNWMISHCMTMGAPLLYAMVWKTSQQWSGLFGDYNGELRTLMNSGNPLEYLV